MDHGMQGPSSPDVQQQQQQEGTTQGGELVHGGSGSQAEEGSGGISDEEPAAALALSKSLQDLVVTVRAGVDAGGWVGVSLQALLLGCVVLLVPSC
jgi:hypothetical protein